MDKQAIIEAIFGPTLPLRRKRDVQDNDSEVSKKTVDRGRKVNDVSKKRFNIQPFYWAWGITLLIVLAFGFYTSHKLSQITTQLERIDTATIRLRTINYSIARPQFEYRIIAPADETFETEMNNYGSSGWEAVSARRAGSGRYFKYEIIMKKRY